MQERAIKTRARILKSSKKLFAKYGYHGLTVDQIANKAKANKQRIYAYFKNKKTLFEECLVSAFEEVTIKEQELLDEINDDVSNMTLIILRFYMNIHDKYPDFWRLIAWANLESDPFYKSLDNIKAESYNKLRILYKQGQEKGIFKKDVSFEVYMFHLIAVTYFYHSNRKTLASTLSEELFTAQGYEKIIKESEILIS
jgi:AcrR family transcriptional regulator